MTFMVFYIASYLHANVRLGNAKEIILRFFLKKILRSSQIFINYLITKICITVCLLKLSHVLFFVVPK
jgi:hypothetical protein